MNRTNRTHRTNRNEGSVLVSSLALSLIIAALSASVMLTTVIHSRSSTEDLDRALARRAAESGVAHYFAEFLGNKNFFDTNLAPLSPVNVGDATFALDDAAPGSLVNQWVLTVTGASGGSIYTMSAAIGNQSVTFPPGIVISGTGNDSDVVGTLDSQSLIGSYDPSGGAFDLMNPDANSQLAINGSMSLNSTSVIHGDVSMSGTLSSGSSSSVTGSLVENGASTQVENIDPIVTSIFNTSQATNDNGLLPGVFGALWFPLSGSENFGNLIVDDGGTYIVPAGTYRLRIFEVTNGSKVIFDTSSGPVNLVYVGAGAGTGSLNDLTVNSGEVVIDSGGTANGLLTVLGSNCDFKITNGSLYGQNVSDPNNAGYTQVISLGGNASSDDIRISSSSFYGRVYAEAHELTIDQGSFYGSSLSRTMTMGSQSTFAIDEGMLGTGLSNPVDWSLLATWAAP